jgi:hypothetical protein
MCSTRCPGGASGDEHVMSKKVFIEQKMRTMCLKLLFASQASPKDQVSFDLADLEKSFETCGLQ